MNNITDGINNYQENRPQFSNKNFAYKVIALIIASYFLTGIIFSIIGSTLILNDFKNDFNLFSQGIIQILIILIPTIYFAKRSPIPYSKLMRRNNLPSLQQVLFSIVGIIAFQAVATGYSVLQDKLVPDIFLDSYNNYKNFIEDAYMSLLGGVGIIGFIKALLIGAMIPAISEESLFRGFFQRSLEEDMPVVRAILISSLIFSVLHLNPINFIPLLGIGIYLGFLAWASRSLILSMLIHFINNTLAVIVIFTPGLSDIEDKSNNMSTMDAAFILFFGLVIMITSCYFILRDPNNNHKLKLST